MSEEYKASLRNMWEQVWNKHNLAVLDEVYAADFVTHQPPFPDEVGLEASKRTTGAILAAFSDMEIQVGEMLAEGDKVAANWKLRGKHTGESVMLKVPPTGKVVTVDGCSIYRFAGGKVVEQWDYTDYLGMLQQTGVIPSERGDG